MEKPRRKTFTIVLLLLAPPLWGQTAASREAQATAVDGVSWLRHLHKALNESAMGRTWDLGPSAPMPGETTPRWEPTLSTSSAQVLTLHGADLYRLNCQGCHGAAGLGTPPEISSVIGPVQATSVAVILARSKKVGQELSRAAANTMAQQAEAALMQRLHKGGQAMPAFGYLSETEIRSTVAYLEQLADVPRAAQRQETVQESRYRVGEYIVKSTCHVCHSAAGPNPSPKQIYDGEIPPLSTLTTRMNLPEFVRKVTQGAPIIMGDPALPYRGRMPVFRYLTPDEAVDAYMYLMLYPPHE